MKPYLLGPILAALLVGCTSRPQPPLPTVETVDTQRYGGLWYEIARYENRFEKGCIGATARYTPDDGRIGVLNRCYDASGTVTSQAKGTAIPVDATGARLEVTFFWPFYGDYWVLMLADDYRFSVVGDPDRRYFWILSRTPQLDPADRERILAAMPDWGYAPETLYWTDPSVYTSGGDSSAAE